MFREKIRKEIMQQILMNKRKDQLKIHFLISKTKKLYSTRLCCCTSFPVSEETVLTSSEEAEEEEAEVVKA